MFGLFLDNFCLDRLGVAEAARVVQALRLGK